MKIFAPKAAVACLAGAALAGCIDNNYDLSDIDKTVSVAVNDLVIPINIDEITLKSIISTSESVVELNGEYAYVHSGTFSSDPVTVNAVKVEATSVEPSLTHLNRLADVPAGMEIAYTVSSLEGTTYEFEALNVTKDIHSISRAMCDPAAPATLVADLDLSDLKGYASKVYIKDIMIQLPKNMIFDSSTPAGSYDPATGYFTIDSAECPTATGLRVTIKAKGFNIAPEEFDFATHKLTLKGEIGMGEGTFLIAVADKLGGFLPDVPCARLNYSFADFTINSFSGELQYTVTDLEVPTIELNDLPDFLNQPGTDLKFKNPQLFLGIHNPMYELGLYAQTGLTLVANRVGQPSKTFSIDNGTFYIGKELSSPNGDYNFCLAPKAATDPQFPNAQFVPFTSLSNVLSGDGLPNSITAELDNPEIPLQACTDFQLGKTYGKVDGSYKIIATFDLAEGSVITYSDTTDGWNDETLDKLTVKSLEVSMNVTTDIPMGVTIKGYPVDKNGKQIGNVQIEGAQINANADNQPVTIRTTGEIKNLDGIVFTAEAKASGQASLSPDMTIKLTNVRPRVSGYYTDEL